MIFVRVPVGKFKEKKNPEPDSVLEPDSEPDPDPLERGTDPGIRIRTKMSRNPNTDRDADP
jgi:hypothetical protein